MMKSVARAFILKRQFPVVMSRTRRPSIIRIPHRCFAAAASDSSSSSSSSSSDKNNTEWRKHQLDRLQRKFEEPLQIDSDEELQPMWKEMESRVTRRRSLTLEQRGGKSGRVNIRTTDEEAWLKAGLYDEAEEEASSENERKPDDRK